MAKTKISKALDKIKTSKRKKGSQASPEGEHYSEMRDKKQKAKPVGNRFKGLGDYKKPTKEQVAADKKKPAGKRKIYFENRADKSDKSPAKKIRRGGKLFNAGGPASIANDVHNSPTAIEVQNTFAKGGTTANLQWHGISDTASASLFDNGLVIREIKGTDGGYAVLYSVGGNAYTESLFKESDVSRLVKGDSWASESQIESFFSYVFGESAGGVDEFLNLPFVEQVTMLYQFFGYVDMFGTPLSKLTKAEAEKILANKYKKGGKMYNAGGPVLPEDGTQADVFENGGHLTDDQIRAGEILSILGGSRRLSAMIGAHTFIARPDGVSFKIKNPKINYIKITVNGMDLFDVEFGKIRGMDYKVVAKEEGLYNNMLKEAIEKQTGMYLTLEDGGAVNDVSIEAPVVNEQVIDEPPVVAVEPVIEVKTETPKQVIIPNFESAAYAENQIEFTGANLQGKQLANGDYVVLSFLYYPIWYFNAHEQLWYGNSDKYNSVTAMHISQSRPTANAEMLPTTQLLDKMNQATERYDAGGMLVRQLYPLTFDNTTIAHQ